MSHCLMTARARGLYRWLALGFAALALLSGAGGRAAAQTPQPGDYKICLPVVTAKSDTAPVYTYKILHTYPHDPNAFTEGLFYRDGYLYEGTGLNGRSDIRQVDLTTGRVLQSRPLPAQYFGEGIAPVGPDLIELTWQSHVAFAYDRASFDPTGQQFAYAGEGWGLTTDGSRLIMSDGTPVLRFRDPATFAETGKLTVADAGREVAQLNELEYVNGLIYANVWMTDRIAMIDPGAGRVTGWIDLRGLREQQGATSADAVLNGIAYDEALNRLFVTGKLWPHLYEIQLVPR